MDINQPQEKITVAINDRGDLNKISSMQLDLLLPRYKEKKRKHGGVIKAQSIPVHQQILSVKVQRGIPIKKATVQVKSITMVLIKKKLFKSQQYKRSW